MGAAETIQSGREKSSQVPLATLEADPCAVGTWMPPGGEAVLPRTWQNQTTMPAP